MTPTRVALSVQLEGAASVLLAVRSGRTSAAALAALAPPRQPGVQAIAFEVLRGLGRAEALRNRLARRAPPPAADALLCCALALLARTDGAARYDPFTLVDQTVEAAKAQRVTHPQAGFLNACLRRFLRERDALLAAVAADLVARFDHPRWWIDRLRADHPVHWQRILDADNRHPPLTLRVNVRQTTLPGYLRELAAAGISAEPVGPFAVQLHEPRPVQLIPGFTQGRVSVQDAAAQRAAPLLLEGLEERSARVLDACAAPGGKTAHLLEIADCAVTALDIDPLRCRRIEQTLARLSLSARVLTADAAHPETWWPSQCGSEPFDAILLDAPCTASGIARRQPDVRWLRRAGDVDRLAETQATLLDALWPLLKEGGRLLYATCSVFHAEGRAQADAFVARHTDARLRPSPGHLLPGCSASGTPVPDNRPGGQDGFFYALLEKRVPTA